ncbi:hypothetical protein MKX01_020681 [Papaver californicum]|nr:hypothetical protein MKX01_020681 [Papaver californicum]
MRTLMNRLIRASQKTCFHYSSVSSKSPVSRLQRPPCVDIQKPFFNSFFQARTFISETPNSVFEGNILRILRNEIQYESEYALPKEPVTTVGFFIVEDRPGEQWIRLRRKFGEEDIQIESTMFNGIFPAPKISDDDTDDDEDRNMQLRISLIVNISKGENDSVLQFVCFSWPDCLEIQKAFVLRHNGMVVKPYAGQNFKDLEDKLQSSLQEFLEVRGVNGELAGFLQEYMNNKDKIELIRWMGNVRSFIEK